MRNRIGSGITALLATVLVTTPANADTVWDQATGTPGMGTIIAAASGGCATLGPGCVDPQGDAISLLQSPYQGYGFAIGDGTSFFVDDFIVSETVDISALRFYGYQTNGSACGLGPTISDVFLRIHRGGLPGGPCATVVYGDLVAGQSTDPASIGVSISACRTGIHRSAAVGHGDACLRPIDEITVNFPSGSLILSPGVYFIEWSLSDAGSCTPSGPWVPLQRIASDVGSPGLDAEDVAAMFGGGNALAGGPGGPYAMPTSNGLTFGVPFKVESHGAYDFTGTGPMQTNDDAADACQVTAYGDVRFDLGGATPDGPGACLPGGRNVWYCFTAIDADSAISNNTGARLCVYDGCAAPTSPIVSGDGNVRWETVIGNQYLVEVTKLDDCTTPCPADLTGDAVVNVLDLLQMLGAWGPNPGHAADLTGDGVVNVLDLLQMLGAWGGCPEGLAICDPDPGTLTFAKAPPGHDDCENPRPMTVGVPQPVDTSGATTDGLAHAFCQYDGQCYNDVWYTLTVPEDGFTTISTCNPLAPDYDTDIALYDSVNCENLENTLVACNDDGCDGPAADFFHSEMVAPMRGGEVYLLRVGGFGPDDHGLTVLNTSHVPADIQDDCGGGTRLELNGASKTADSSDYTPDGATPGTLCGGAVPSADGLWYRFTGNGTDVKVSTCASGTTYPSALSVYCGGCTNLRCVGYSNADFDCFVAFGDGVSLDFCSQAGLEYFVLVHGQEGGDSGPVEIFVTGGDPGNPADVCSDFPNCGLIANDDYADRLPIFNGVTAFTTDGAGTDGAAHAACQDTGQTHHDIWFEYTATATGNLTVSTCDLADYDTDLVVYSGCPASIDDLLFLDCNDDFEECANFTSQITAPVTLGNCYIIRIGGWEAGDFGDGSVSISVN